jgi:putative heme-binding domain-containing protein
MTLPRRARLVPPAAVLAAALLLPADATPQQKKGRAKPAEPTEPVLPTPPRPKKPPLPASATPLAFVKGERIALVGGSTAERMNLFGHFETMLHLRFPDKELVVRNFGFPADEVGVRQRSTDYTRIDDPITAFNPDTFLCLFGFNESFHGPAGVETFKADYERFLDEYARKYPRDDAGSPPRFVLVSPIAFEPTGDRFLPDGGAGNANLRLYADAVKAVAAKRGLAFADVLAPTLRAFAAEPGMQFTVNGAHVNEAGDREVARALDAALFGEPKGGGETSVYEKVRAAVNDKSWVHQQDYRMLNGWYVYGSRRTWDHETFPREYVKLRNMAAVRDQRVWDLARGREVPDKPDDSKTGELVVPPTRFGDPRQRYSENAEGGPRIQPPADLIRSCTLAPGLTMKLFASEERFPELAKPVQMNFDGKGRLWVSCMPNYPQWKPGDPPANDRLLILEDTDGDGTADKCTVFYDKLHCPTGFEFWNGGVLVMSQPRILFLKDTDGDDKADQVVPLLDGWATDDTHHRGGWEWNHGGRLHLLEGISTSTTLETPWGPHRSAGAGGAYQIDPRSLRVRQFSLPGMANMWCYHFDEWGQGFVGDGTTPNQAWDTPLSGAQFTGRKGLNFLFDGKGERPNIGSERLVSRALPDDLQGQFVYASVITTNGLPRFTLADDGAGFKGKRVLGPDGKPSDLVRSTDKHFRPSDPQIGPDGALWFGDWANPLVGHMQYSQRDPNRDHVHGRIYRVFGTDKPLVKPVTQYGKTAAEILDQLREYEWRTRYRARRELNNRPADEVLPAVAAWVARLDPADREYDRLRTDALWIQAGHHAVDPALLKSLLAAKEFRARAAAVHVVADERDRVPGAFELLRAAAADEHPRVRTEAARGLSFYPTPAAAEALVAITRKPMDYWVRYTVEAAFGANEPVWRPAFLSGSLAKDAPDAKRVLTDVLANSKAGGAASPFLQILLDPEAKSPDIRQKAMAQLAGLRGNPSRGREVFVRNCTACHRVGNGEGQEYGPNLAGVMTRQKDQRYKLVESVIDPNAEVDAKYLSTRIETADGVTVTGLVVAEDGKRVTIFDGKDKKTIPLADVERRTVLKQSSMPEGLAGAMAPAEFLDLIEYLAAQREPGK